MHVTTRETAVTDATLIALAANGMAGAQFAIAADIRRYAGWDYYRVSTLRCEVPDGVPESYLVRGSGLHSAQVHGCTPTAVALAYLDEYLLRPPYLVVAHQAGLLGALVRRHAAVCPRLAAAALIDTAELACRLRGVPTSAPLEFYAEELGTPLSDLTDLAKRAALTAGLFSRLVGETQRANVDLETLVEHCAPAVRLELTARPL